MACGYSHDIEEVREGEEKPYLKPTNRKRSARGAKCTKPAIDGEGCGCKGSKKGKKSCSCDTCSPKMDSLTAGTFRADLKCGRGSISEGEKCTKGSAERVQRKGGSRVRAGLENAAILVGTAGTWLSYGQGLGNIVSNDIRGTARALQLGGAFTALRSAGEEAKGRRTGNKRLQGKARRALGSAAVAATLGTSFTDDLYKVSTGAKTGLRNALGRASAAKGSVTYRNAKSQFERMYKRPGRRDSVYAPGFTPDMEHLSI